MALAILYPNGQVEAVQMFIWVGGQPQLWDGSITVSTTGSAIEDGSNPTIKATVFNLTNSNPLSVAIVDANGDAITSFGGGTQYTEDSAAAANPIGTAVNLIRQDTPAGLVTTDGDNVAQRATNFGAAYTQLLTSAGAFLDDLATGTLQAAGNTTLSSIDSQTALVLAELGSIEALLGVAATAAKQDTGNTSLSSIDSKLTDVATQTTLALIKANTDNIDVALSTRTKPSDQQHVIVDSSASIAVTGPLTDTQLRASDVKVTLDGETVVLAAGSAIIGKVGIDQTTPGTTNGVQVNAALPAGSNAIGKLAANSGVDIGDVDVTSLPALTAGSNLIGYVGQKNTYGSKTTLTTTNWSNLASGSGWQSDSIATSGAREILINFKTKGAAGSTLFADFYLAEQLTSGNWTDGATGTEGTFTASSRKNSVPIGSIQLNTTNSVTGMLRVSAVVGILPPVMALIGINNSGGTISSTGGDTVFEYQLVN